MLTPTPVGIESQSQYLAVDGRNRLKEYSYARKRRNMDGYEKCDNVLAKSELYLAPELHQITSMVRNFKNIASFWIRLRSITPENLRKTARRQGRMKAVCTLANRLRIAIVLFGMQSNGKEEDGWLDVALLGWVPL